MLRVFIEFDQGNKYWINISEGSQQIMLALQITDDKDHCRVLKFRCALLPSYSMKMKISFDFGTYLLTVLYYI